MCAHTSFVCVTVMPSLCVLTHTHTQTQYFYTMLVLFLIPFIILLYTIFYLYSAPVNKTEKEVHGEIQGIIRQISASVSFLPVISTACKSLYLEPIFLGLICICICICTCTNIHVHLHLHTHVHVCMHPPFHFHYFFLEHYLYIYTYTHTYIYIHIIFCELSHLLWVILFATSYDFL